MTSEPTVLDFVKALLTPWRGAPPRIPPDEPTAGAEQVGLDAGIKIDTPRLDREISVIEEIKSALPEIETGVRISAFPWRAPLALGFALVAQLTLEPGPDPKAWELGLFLYSLAAGLGIWAILRGEWTIPSAPESKPLADNFFVRQTYLWIGGILSVLAFLALGGNRFNELNVLLWIAALFFICLAFWTQVSRESDWLSRFRERFSEESWKIGITRWTLILVLAGLVVLFFRFFRLGTVPPEMVSDHAEKLLDIWDVLQGQASIFFPRNTGREGFQMYLTAAVIRLFDTGFSFQSMKIGTALAGLATLPFIYLLGKEIGNKRAGLLAMVFAGIGYWPNVITRVALRFTFYPLFVAPTLYFVIRGLRRSNRNDFILAGLFLGLGLHGYTPFRIVPFVVLTAVGLYLLHPESRGLRRRTLFYLLLLGLVALLVFLPLLRFWVEYPELFGYRAFTRLGGLEQPLPGPALQIFFQNLLRAVLMFAWNNGEIWPVSIPNRPALDVVSAALFYLGVTMLVVRYLRRRNWIDPFLILSVPLLMLPSILSLAFPSENPALNRTAGALVPVFVIIGLSLDGFMKGLEDRLGSPAGIRLAWGVGIFLLIWSGSQNYRLVFTEYQENYSLSSWNTSEIGGVIRDFSETVGTSDHAYVVAYPHWVDTRLVGINAGFPTRDFALWPENFSTTFETPGAKLFVIKPEDTDSLSTLQGMYPRGYLTVYDSQAENKDFYMYFVLPEVENDG